MRKIVFALITVLALCSCKKQEGLELEQGTYVASVSVGEMLNIELLSDEKCILYFTGGPERIGEYHLNGDKIAIIGSATTTDGMSLIFSFSNPGTIYSKTSFAVSARSARTGGKIHCSFVKR